MILPPSALAEVLQNFPGHILGLIILIHGGVQLKGVPRPRPCPKFLALAALVVPNHGVGRIQNMAGRAVVLLQADHPSPLVLLFKGEDIFYGSPPEPVDGLVVVPYHAEVLIPPRQGGGQQILQVIGILILVDQDIAEFFLIVRPHLVKALQQPDRVEDDVIKIQGIGVPEPALIFHIDLGNLGQPEIPRLLALGQIVGSQLHGVLCPGDIPQNGPGRELLVVNVLFLDNVFQHPQGVVSVVDGKGGRKPQLVDIPAQNSHTGRVEGAGPDVIGCGAQHLGQTLLQFSSGLVGKCNGQNGPGGGGIQAAQPFLPVLVPLSRLGVRLQKGQVFLGDKLWNLLTIRSPAIFHQICDPVDEHCGLAAPCPSQKEERPLGSQRRFLLFGVQPAKLPGDGPPAGFAESKLLIMVQHM